ncbi:MAG: WG repeat-containing protein, partial [Flavobacterium sp.]|nr:WG repeat-containing protein [Flavobacterium sp.]
MADYIYINHINENEEYTTISEWKYLVPVYMYPLFHPANQPDEKNLCLYSDTAQAIASFKKFYDFLEKHAEIIFEKPQNFIESKRKIFDFLEKFVPSEGQFELNLEFVLDAIASKKSEKKQLLNEFVETLNQTNAAIFDAIEKDNPQLLLEISVEETHHKNLKEALNDEDYYNYGYDALYTYGKSEDDVYFYEEIEKFGIKNGIGKTLLKPEFDEVKDFIYWYGEVKVAIVCKNNLWGIINQKGETIIPFEYQEIINLDTYSDYQNVKEGQEATVFYTAVVKKEGLYGVINEKKQWIIPNQYNFIKSKEVSELGYILLYKAQKNDKFGILNWQGNEVYPFEADAIYIDEIENENLKGFDEIYSKILVFKENVWFYLNGNFKPFAENIKLKLDISKDFESKIKIYVGQKGKFYGVINSNDEILIPFEYQKIKEFYNFLSLEQNNQKGLFDLIQNKIVLPIAYEDFLFTSDDEVFTLADNEISQYFLTPLTPVTPFNFDALETYLKGNKSKQKNWKSALENMRKNSNFMQTFFNQEEQSFIHSLYGNIIWDSPQSLVESGEFFYNREEPEFDATILEMIYRAYTFHFENGSGNANHYDMVQYFYSRYLKEKKSFLDAANWLEKLSKDISILNPYYFDVQVELSVCFCNSYQEESCIAHSVSCIETLDRSYVSRNQKTKNEYLWCYETLSYYIVSSCIDLLFANKGTKMQLLEQAEKYLEMTSTINPTSEWNSSSKKNLEIMLFHLKEIPFSQWQQKLENRILEENNHPTLWYIKAKELFKLNDTKAAYEAIKTAKKLSSNEPKISEYYKFSCLKNLHFGNLDVQWEDLSLP